MALFRTLLVAVLGGLISSVALAEAVFVEIHPKSRASYRRGVMLLTGYRDTKIGPGIWKVSSVVGSGTFHWLTDKVVIRRASELTIAYGKPFVRLTVKKAVRTVAYNMSSGDLVVEATAVDERDATAHCEKRISVFTCKTFSAEVAMVETLPYLKLPTDR